MQHLVHLVDDLLDVSRITTGRMTLRKSRVELASAVRSAVEATRPIIESSEHEFTVVLPPQPILLEADPTRLAQVFSNLLTNAARYTDPGGRIRLVAERQGGEAVVTVSDNGIGIPAEMQDRIFEMFTQADQKLERSQSGLGIGLTLARRLVEMHGGTIGIRSDGPGRGSEFIVRLPMLHEPIHGLPPTDDEGVTAAGRLRILAVDDNEAAAKMIGVLLRTMGHEVRTARDGLEAIDAAEAFRPDLVLMDIGMPRLNGYEAARRLRQQPWGRDLVLVALTGWGQNEDKQRAKAAGFDHHLVKPVEAAALRRLLTDRQRERC